MKSRVFVGLLTVLALIFGVTLLPAYESMVGPTGVLLYDKENSYGGYALFAPIGSRTTYLMDMEGNVVHTWEAQYNVGYYAILLENGNLLRGGTLPGAPAPIGGASGIVQELDWDGNVVWEYKLLTDNEVHHHTFARMPNGNTLLLAWERKTLDEFIAKGRDPKTIHVTGIGRGGTFRKNDFWVDFVREVNPAGETVWEWHVWDHIGTGPYQFDINYMLPGGLDFYDWTHFNSVEYIPETDSVLLNSRNFSEFYMIDHKTGNMVYRWGNPSAYGQGEAPSWLDNGDQKVFGNHDASYLGGNRVLVFDNGSERPEGNRSAVVEVDIRSGDIVWQYTAPSSNSFYTARQGGAQKLPNGNVFVTSANSGHLFEVTQDKAIVWDFVSPVAGQNISCSMGGFTRGFNMIHRAYRYGADYPGLEGKDLSKKTPLAASCPEFYKLYKTDVKPAPKKKAFPKRKMN